MHQHAGYSQQSYHQAATAHRYPSTSSAFSASANPNEDWTKISDLAERRRIQNRIAQRNYRESSRAIDILEAVLLTRPAGKKLKKRLEDLERRAASNSASPEQKPAELARTSPHKKNSQSCSEERDLSSDYSSFDSQTSQAPSGQYLQFDGRDMFTEQYTRQLSTSPPPFVYSSYPTETMGFAAFSHQEMSYPSVSSADMPIFPSYLPPLSSQIPTTMGAMEFPVKQEHFLDAEFTPFGLTYASMANIDITAAQSYADSNSSHVGIPFRYNQQQ